MRENLTRLKEKIRSNVKARTAGMRFPRLAVTFVEKHLASGYRHDLAVIRGLQRLSFVPAVFIVAIAWIPVDKIINRILYEDFFYYIKVAENIAAGYGATLDGVAPTNGFHPLWMLVSVFLHVLTTPDTVVHVLLTIAALLHIGQAVLVFRILRKMTNPMIAQLAAMFYLINYRIIACNLSGLETPAQIFCILLLVYLTIVHSGELGLAGSLRFGFLLGLSIWARFDFLLGSLLFLGYVILSSRFARRVLLRFSFAAIIAGSTLFSLAPWFLWSLRNSGVLLPNSERALKIWAFPNFDFTAPFSFNLALLGKKIVGALEWLPDSANLLGLFPVVSKRLYLLGDALFLALLISLAAFVWRRKDGPHRSLRIALFFFGISHMAYYCLFARAEVRYLLPANIVFLLLLAMQIHDLLKQEKLSVRWGAVGLSLLLCVNMVLASVSAWQKHQGATRTHALHQNLYQAARWLSVNIPIDARVGSWNAGILSYYSHRLVVNLDGVINDDVIEWLRKKDLTQYIQKRNVTYLVDLKSTIKFFMSQFSNDPNWGEKYQVIQHFGMVEVRRKIS